MACTIEFMESLRGLLLPLGDVSYLKMMGDYVVYVNGKCVITACDNVAYVKKLACIGELMCGAKCGSPYPGAKEAYILDLSDVRRTLKTVETLWEALPFPKSKKPKQV